MPKMKTHKGTAKRVRLTGTGKVMFRSPNPKKAKRSRAKMAGLGRDVVADSTVTRTIKINLPYA